jgi:hypothetical protein
LILLSHLLRHATGVSMNTVSSNAPFWWDRELDSTGKTIRPDVRSAALEIWEVACNQTRALLGEPCDASGLMERSVAQISRYLNVRETPLFAQDASGLLMCAFYRSLRRHVAKLKRIELAADIGALSESGPARNCTKEEDCRMDAEKAARQLSQRGRQMYELRKEGFEWREIAEKLNITDAAARAEFSRELKRARLRMKNKSLSRADTQAQKGSAQRRECNS